MVSRTAGLSGPPRSCGRYLTESHELEAAAINEAVAIAWSAEGDDGDPVYGGVVLLSEGRPDIFSEIALRDQGDWLDWIRKQVEKPEITAVWLPEGVALGATPTAGKLRRYSLTLPAEAASAIPAARRTHARTLLAAGALAALVAISLFMFAGAREIAALAKSATDSVTSLWKPPPPETVQEHWILRQDIEAAAPLCDAALSWPWPVSPEWTLTEEGCAFDVRPDDTPGSTPWPQSLPRSFAWRYYQLEDGFVPWLATQAAGRMEDGFTGEVTRDGETGLVYILELAVPVIESRPGEYSAVPDDEIMPLLRAASIGTSLRPPEQSGRGGWILASTLGRRALLELVTDLRLSPRVIWVDMTTGGHSSIEVVGERLRNDWREVPAPAGGGT